MNFRLQNIQKDGKVRYEMKFMALISYAGITRIRFEGPDGNASHLSRRAPAPLGL